MPSSADGNDVAQVGALAAENTGCAGRRRSCSQEHLTVGGTRKAAVTGAVASSIEGGTSDTASGPPATVLRTRVVRGRQHGPDGGPGRGRRAARRRRPARAAALPRRRLGAD